MGESERIQQVLRRVGFLFAIAKTCLNTSGENSAENDLKTKDIRNVQRKASARCLNVVGTGSPRLGPHAIICAWG